MAYDTGPDQGGAEAGTDESRRLDRLGNGFAVAAVLLLIAVILLYLLYL